MSGDCRISLRQAAILPASLGETLMPVVGRMAAAEHSRGHTISIRPAVIDTFGVLIVQPGKNDNALFLAIAKKQTILLPKLAAAPVSIAIS